MITVSFIVQAVLYSVAHILLSNADFGRLAKEFIWKTLLAETLTVEVRHGELRARTEWTFLRDTFHLSSAQAETVSTVRVLEDLALEYPAEESEEETDDGGDSPDRVVIAGTETLLHTVRPVPLEVVGTQAGGVVERVSGKAGADVAQGSVGDDWSVGGGCRVGHSRLRVVASNYFKPHSNALMPLSRMEFKISGEYQTVEILS